MVIKAEFDKGWGVEDVSSAFTEMKARVCLSSASGQVSRRDGRHLDFRLSISLRLHC